MSSDRRSDAPSPAAEAGDLAALISARGAPLLEALESHAPAVRAHSDTAALYAFVAAVELGYERPHCEAIRATAALHEVGRVYLPAQALGQGAGGGDADRASYEAQLDHSYRLARGAGIPEEQCLWLLHARERFDGAGPGGLAGEEIPLESRVIRAACRWQTALEQAESEGSRPVHLRAIASIEQLTPAELDPRVTAALAAVITRAVPS